MDLELSQAGNGTTEISWLIKRTNIVGLKITKATQSYRQHDFSYNQTFFLYFVATKLSGVHIFNLKMLLSENT